MAFTVTNQQNDTSFTVDTDETILAAALRDNRVYPYGCRNGVCGACKATLISGEVDYGQYEEFALTEADKQQKMLLLCQAKPLSDIIISADETAQSAGVQIKMLPCRVRTINRLAQDVVQLFLDIPKTQEFNFTAGQYIDIVLKNGKRRSFSIANLAQQATDQGIELHIRHVVDGHFTPFVFNALKERDLLRFEGPFGTYFFRSDSDTPTIMIAGGTGFAPVKGLIQEAFANNAEQHIHLFWGARDEQDLYMDELVKEWLTQFKNFQYTPVLSESTSSDWQGLTGFVNQAVADTYDDFSAFDIYASGPPIMIDTVKESLLAKNMDVSRFFFDSFEFAPQDSVI